MSDECRFGGKTKENGNCTVRGDDGLPVQWVLGPRTNTTICGDTLRLRVDLAASTSPRADRVAPRSLTCSPDQRTSTLPRCRLASFKRMDLIVFFPVGELRRFLERSSKKREQLDRALGTDDWRTALRSAKDAPKLIPFFRGRMEKKFGYKAENSYSAPIRNTKNVVMYHLVFLSKHTRGASMWESVTRKAPSGKRRLF
jgi:hypothetical protein